VAHGVGRRDQSRDGVQVHLLAQTTAEKYAALRKVYIGIMILLALTAVFLTILGIHVFAPAIV
jgi:hypothetical protein